MILAAILMSSCIGWVNLVSQINSYSPVQIRQVLESAQVLPAKDKAMVARAIRYVYAMRQHGLDPVKQAEKECHLKGA